jgi:aerobic-type carbon monoxide dehydrogenase small subunit (CoxS/CutS family)
MAELIELVVNGRKHTIHSDRESSLLAVLRDELGLTGSKYGCGEGQCGACTVLLDGTARRSCITPLSAAAGKSILTIEGLEQSGRLHPVQQAFLDAEAFQCAYCTSGMILSSVALLQQNADPSPSEIEQALQGNICRCGAHPRIIEAVKKAALAGREHRS